MPSEGKPLPIDTALITTPENIPTTDVRSMADRRARHSTRLTGAHAGLYGSATSQDAIAALALGTGISRQVAEEQPHLILEALRRGSSWQEIAAAIGSPDPDKVHAAFVSWAQHLSGDEHTEAVQLAKQ